MEVFVFQIVHIHPCLIFQVVSKRIVLCQLFGFAGLSGLSYCAVRTVIKVIKEIEFLKSQILQTVSPRHINVSHSRFMSMSARSYRFFLLTSGNFWQIFAYFKKRVPNTEKVISNFIYQIMNALKCICRSVEFGYLYC